MIQSTAVLALHFQNEVLHPSGKIRLGVAEEERRRRTVDQATAYLRDARTRGLPVIHVRIAFPIGHRGVLTNAPIFRDVVEAGAMEEGSWGSEFYESLEPLSGEDIVTHSRVNAFFDSPLEQILRRKAVTTLIMAGVATNSVVEHSARHAADIGYRVIVAADACSAASEAVHDAALFNLSLIGEVSTVAGAFTHD